MKAGRLYSSRTDSASSPKTSAKFSLSYFSDIKSHVTKVGLKKLIMDGSLLDDGILNRGKFRPLLLSKLAFRVHSEH